MLKNDLRRFYLGLLKNFEHLVVVLELVFLVECQTIEFGNYELGLGLVLFLIFLGIV